MISLILILITIFGYIFLFAGAFVIITLPLTIPYYWYLGSWGEKNTLPKDFSLFKGFFKFYSQLLRFKKPKF